MRVQHEVLPAPSLIHSSPARQYRHRRSRHSEESRLRVPDSLTPFRQCAARLSMQSRAPAGREVRSGSGTRMYRPPSSRRQQKLRFPPRAGHAQEAIVRAANGAADGVQPLIGSTSFSPKRDVSAKGPYSRIAGLCERQCRPGCDHRRKQHRPDQTRGDRGRQIAADGVARHRAPKADV
jgi:hypothetical protein